MKKIVALFLTILLCGITVACGADDGAKSDVSEETVAEKENSVDEEQEESEVVEDTTPVLGVGETVTIADVCEFYVDYTNITNDVMPPQPGSWYSHYEAESGKVYVDICVAYKNLATGNIAADEVLNGILIYGDKYEYKGFSMIEEESRSDFTYSNITSIAPLSTEYVHYLFEVPEEVQTSEASLAAKMTIGSEDYKIVVKEGNSGAEEAASADETEEAAETKTSGAVIDGETVVTKNAEFYVDYSNITSDVMPPQPGSWYSHYEAESGKVYVDFCVAYKNTSSSNVGADDVLSAKLTYAGKYEYGGFSMIEEESRSDFTYSNITSIAPLSTEYVHYLFEVPEEVANSSETVEISFSIDGNSYTYTVR